MFLLLEKDLLIKGKRFANIGNINKIGLSCSLNPILYVWYEYNATCQKKINKTAGEDDIELRVIVDGWMMRSCGYWDR